MSILARARKRRYGLRLYLVAAFAAVALITAGLTVLIASGISFDAADESAVEVSVGRSIRLADAIGAEPDPATFDVADAVNDPGFSSWVFDANGALISSKFSRGVDVDEVPLYRARVNEARRGSRTVQRLADGKAIIATPILNDGDLQGALLVQAVPPKEITAAVEDVQSRRFTAALVAIGVAMLLGFGIASAISYRVRRLADSAGRMTEGQLDEPLEGTSGRDEIADLARALDTMRGALRETFTALSSERDRLSAIFDALDDAVMVVGHDGSVRFANTAAEAVLDGERMVPLPLLPWLRHAQASGLAEHDSLRIGERVVSVSLRKLPTEGAVLAVIHDRTEELRREMAEREFVSNAAHELRNPIAAISGTVEVLSAGAKDDPAARDRFLARLEGDVVRMRRLTEALLTLARVEAGGDGEPSQLQLDVNTAINEAVQAVTVPEGIEVDVDSATDLVAIGDNVLVRQVLIGLLTNAFKHTEPPGKVTVVAHRVPADERTVAGIRIEVSDTGTGILDEDVNRIFERFYRGAGSLEREGFGLGLSIAKRMVDVMGGDIGVESSPGVGSTFFVRLNEAGPTPTPLA